MQTEGTTEGLVCYETLPRSFVKSLVYRILSLAGTVILSWSITKDVSQTVSITLAVQAFLVVLYFVYERIWNNIRWGRKFDIRKRDVKLANVTIEYYI
jgi:uncharacterized membrane protein|tara:strand:+ start:241 stop:534 length:294 start_codon:yes stop_codon:yes gene_type:complete